VVLELNPGEPISGRIQDASGDAETFHGWLDLAGKLDRLRAGIPVDQPDPDPDRPAR
jgi:hypothetical protein